MDCRSKVFYIYFFFRCLILWKSFRDFGFSECLLVCTCIRGFVPLLSLGNLIED